MSHEPASSTSPGTEWFEKEVLHLLPDLMDGARSLASTEADAEDLVSQAVTRAWAHLPDLQDRARFRGWMFCILRNAFLSRRRKRTSRPDEIPFPGEGEDEPSFLLFEHLHEPSLLWSDNPERRVQDDLLREDLEAALASLPDVYRCVVRLVDVRGFRYSEVAGALEIPVGTVRSRLARGRALLRRHLWHHAVDRGLREPASQASQEGR
jgi:RNA polymerase sigma-70 factor, ECF subfamily